MQTQIARTPTTRFLLIVFVCAASFMLIYEALKEYALPWELSAWESHTMTIIVTSLVATIISYFTLRKIRGERDERMALELRAGRFKESLLNLLPVAVFYKDREGRYLGCNRVFTDIMGVSEQNLIGKTVFELWPSDMAHIYHQKDLELMAARGHQTYEFQVKDKDGIIRDVIYSKSIFLDDQEQTAGLIGAFFDISDRKQVAEALAAYRNHLEELVRERTAELEMALGAKRKFLSNMSHELLTPINAISGFAQLIQQNLAAEAVPFYLRTIQANVDNLTALIRNILDVSEMGSGRSEIHKSPFSLSDLIVFQLGSATELVGSKLLQIRSEVSPNIPACVLGDELKLARVVQHLLSNAIKFSQEGEIWLRVSLKDRESARYRFEIQDQGIGIPLEQQKRIFELFTQEDESHTRQYGGAGLGLALCNMLVTSMGGSIGVASEVNVGSTFWFEVSLPDAECLPDTNSPE